MRQSLELYVPLQFCVFPPRPGQVVDASQRFSLEDLMKNLIFGTLADIHACFPELSRPNEKTRVFLIQGSAGAGKSLFSWRTVQYFDSTWTSVSSSSGIAPRVPIFVSLPSVKDRVLLAPADFLVQAITDAYPSLKHIFKTLNPLSRQELLSGLPFLFILDSVDELADAAAIDNVNRLYNPVQWLHSVFVISARSEVLNNAILSSALPPRQFLPDGPVQPALMSQLFLLPFDATQRAKYIDVFARKNIFQDWNAEKYTEALKQFPEVDSMLQEPLQLFLILSVVPVLVAAKDEAVPTNFCVKHQCVAHTVHVLYREEDKDQALKLAADMEQHTDAKRKGLTIFLKDTCGPAVGTAASTTLSRHHLQLSDKVIPVISSSVVDISGAADFFEELQLALERTSSVVCPVFLTPDASSKLKAAGLPSTAVKSLEVLDKCHGLILNASKGRTSWIPWLEKVIQELVTNRTFHLVLRSSFFYFYCRSIGSISNFF